MVIIWMASASLSKGRQAGVFGLVKQRNMLDGIITDNFKKLIIE